MNQANKPISTDFTDLGFDLEPHRETVASFAKMNLAPSAVQPALRARDMAFVRFPSSRIALRVTEDHTRQEAVETSRGGIGFAVIHQAENAEDAWDIRAEVERYFLRHFPGRTLAESEATSRGGTSVYIVCFAPPETEE